MMDSLPPELLVQVCSFLCTVSLCKLCRASKALRITLKDDSDAWENALQSMWWYHFDTLKRHDNFTFWCSQFAIRNGPPPNQYTLHKELGKINSVYVFEFPSPYPVPVFNYTENLAHIMSASSAPLHDKRNRLDPDEIKMEDELKHFGGCMERYGCFVCPDTGRFHCMYKIYLGRSITKYLRYISFMPPDSIGQLYVNISTKTVHYTRHQNAMCIEPPSIIDEYLL